MRFFDTTPENKAIVNGLYKVKLNEENPICTVQILHEPE